MKAYRYKEMVWLLIAYSILVLIWGTSMFDGNLSVLTSNYSILIAVIESFAMSGILSILVFLGDCLITSALKDRLVGLFFIPRAGSMIFTKIKNGKTKDDRFLLSDAQKQYSEIFSEMPTVKKELYKYENSKWYRIYNHHREKDVVMQAQSDYLICRDLYTETLLFICLYLLSLTFGETIIFSPKLILVLLSILVITNISTHIKMQRFVNTVIAVDIVK